MCVLHNLLFHPVMPVSVLLLGDRNNEDCDITPNLKESKYGGTVGTSDWIYIMRGIVVKETGLRRNDISEAARIVR